MRDLFEQALTNAGIDTNRWSDTDELEGEYLSETAQKMWEAFDSPNNGTLHWAPVDDGSISFAMHLPLGTVDPSVLAIGQVLNRVFSSEENLGKLAVALGVIKGNPLDELAKMDQEMCQ